MQDSSLINKDLKSLLDGFQGTPEERKRWENNFSTFGKLSENLEKNEILDWVKIKPLNTSSILIHSKLEQFDKVKVREYLNKLIVVKLNGGLGTTLGCHGPKSLITVRDGKSFLDLTIDQLESLNKKYDLRIPLVLMNSFNTEKKMKLVLHRYEKYITPIHMFNQDQCPRLNDENRRPMAESINGSKPDCWYPPGHGNFYESFYNTGLLQKFLDEGKKIAFISNIDNLGATVDLNIISHIFSKGDENVSEFLIEVTDKTRSDVKGGTIIHYEDQTRLLEIAQVPSKHVEDFKSVSKFKIFNTNNLWVKLESVKELVRENKMQLDLIINKKVLSDGSNVIQLETAVAAAIRNFKNPISVNVARSRFLPVKNVSDLFLVMSNLYTLESGYLTMNTKRQFHTTPFVNFTGEGFQNVESFLKRFPAIPDILELDHLTVSGDVSFGNGVSLSGTVVIISQYGNKIDIPPGSILENKIVTGSLRILSS